MWHRHMQVSLHFVLLFQRLWDKQRIIDFLSVLDWMMSLPADLNDELWRDIQTMEGSNAMPYMSYFERKFRDEGRHEGRQEGLQRVLSIQMEERFGTLPKEVQARLAAASDEQLVAWAKALLDAATLEQVFHSR